MLEKYTIIIEEYRCIVLLFKGVSYYLIVVNPQIP